MPALPLGRVKKSPFDSPAKMPALAQGDPEQNFGAVEWVNATRAGFLADGFLLATPSRT